MPQFLSAEAQSLLRALFKRNPCNRLGKSPKRCARRGDAPWGRTADCLPPRALKPKGPAWGGDSPTRCLKHTVAPQV